MAGIFESFRNSSMPKRLLRYALARFDVLDAETLDLDNLDLAWGMKTVLEFRDVGLKLKVLQQLLQLPPTFHIGRAKVALLRVTLPVDFYSSPIQIQVTGVDVRLKVSSREETLSDDSNSSHRRRRDQAADAAADTDAVPSAVDLAQSFLQEQPSGEKEKLEQVLAAEAAHRGQKHGAGDSQSEYDDDYNDDYNDDDDDTSPSSSQTLGTGQALTLPTFLASFLQGIVDRVQVRIEGVTFQLEVAVPLDTFPAAAAAAVGVAPATTTSEATTTTATPDSVIFELALARINVEGVTTAAPSEGARESASAAGISSASTAKGPGRSNDDDDEDDDNDGNGSISRSFSDGIPIVPKEGKRHISLENVRAFLISEANVFSHLARSPSMPSSMASSESPVMAPAHDATAGTTGGPVDPLFSRPPSALSSPSPSSSSRSSPSPSLTSHASLRERMLEEDSLQDSEDAFNIPYELDGSSGDENDQYSAGSGSGGGEAVGIPLFDGPNDGHEEAEIEAQDYADADADASPNSTPRASVYGELSAPLPCALPPFVGISPSPSPPPSRAATVAGTAPPAFRGVQSALVGMGAATGSWHAASGTLAVISRSHSGAFATAFSGGSVDGPGVVGGSVHGGRVRTEPVPNEDDLARSHLFSHADAESMYMSAFSQAESVRMRGRGGAMPGSWDSEDGHENDGDCAEDDEDMAAVFRRPGSSGHPYSDDMAPSFYAPPLLAERAPERMPEAPAETREAPTMSVEATGETGEEATAAGPATPPPSLDSSSPSLPLLPDFAEADAEVAADDAGLPPDEAATPRGPTRLVKEILSLKYISIYVPSRHDQSKIPVPPPTAHLHHHHHASSHHSHGSYRQRQQQQQQNLARSVAPHLPGAFSVYSAHDDPPAVRDHVEDSHFQMGLPPAALAEPDKAVEVTLAPAEVRFDASIGFLLAMVVSELTRSLQKGLEQQQRARQQRQQKREERGTASGATASPRFDIKFHADSISLLFLDRLAGVADTAERFFDSSSRAASTAATAAHLGPGQEVLLQTVLEHLAVDVSMEHPAQATTAIHLQRFRFGYGDADIISFDRRMQMRASVRDAFPPSGDDVSIRISQSTGATKCEINTLPLLVTVNLQRLDETLGWFGGLSSFLSMGSSSVASQSGGGGGGGVGLAAPSAAPGKAAKARGVRFEAPISPDDRSAAAENKVDMRLGGLHLELVGRDCSVALDTTAVKLVSREEGVGVGVTRIRLGGPYLRASSAAAPPVSVEVANTRLEFLNVPKERDLEWLLELVTPSHVQFDEREDVIMVDTLLRQRRSGPLLRLTMEDVHVEAHNLAQLACLPGLGEEMARLASVAKYLPEDDRPGLLTLGVVRRLDVSADLAGLGDGGGGGGGAVGRLGTIQASLTDCEVAHISLPSLVSVAVGTLSMHRNQTEELIGCLSMATATATATAASALSTSAAAKRPSTAGGTGSLVSPALMLRIIGDDMEPVIKIKMWGLNFEYRVPTIMDLLGLAEDATPQDFEAGLAASVAQLGEHAHSAMGGLYGGGESKVQDRGKGKADPLALAERKPTKMDLAFRDCVLGLNPLKLASKLNVVIVDARLEVEMPPSSASEPRPGEGMDAVFSINKMSLLLIDDVGHLAPATESSGGGGGTVTFAAEHARRRSSGTSGTGPAVAKDMVSRLCARGYVDVCQISSAKIMAHVSDAETGGGKLIDLEVRDDLLVLETCADSTQTLIGLANALTPPMPPSQAVKFQTEVMPVQDLLASISIDAFGRAEGNYNFDEDFVLEGGGGHAKWGDGDGGDGHAKWGDGDGGDGHAKWGDGGGGHAEWGDYDEDEYGIGSSSPYVISADEENRPSAAELSVSSLPSMAAEDDDLILDDAEGHMLDSGEVEAEALKGTAAATASRATATASRTTTTASRAETTASRATTTAPRVGAVGAVAETLFSAASSVLSDKTQSGAVSAVGAPDDDGAHLGTMAEIGFENDFFGAAATTGGEEPAAGAPRWSSAQNAYDRSGGAAATVQAPVRVRVRDVHLIWNLFDGYDWQHTRDVIAKTVEEVEAKAYERRMRQRRRSGHQQAQAHDQNSPYADDEEEDDVIGDFLFNSIYIGIPASHDPRGLAQAINQNLAGAGGGDLTAETESVAATTVTGGSRHHGHGGHHGQHHGGRHVGGHLASTARPGRSKRLRLHRSRHHKITFELGGLGAELVMFPAGSGETQTSVEVRVRDLDVFDHVPTSTWKKFATYDRDAGERPIDGDMVRLEVLVVKPVPELAATELVLKVNVLPLRLHVDQDALDFITRFFEFKDEAAAAAAAATTTKTPAGSGDVPFIQRAEIRDIPVQLDFKPKRVDYAGLRSGHTTEFMNFLILEGSRMTMRHTIIYGISGFERLGQTLNDIWMPDIKRHQLPGVLAGLAPVRSLVTVGSGFRDLIEIPIQEYRHNGRIVRSISKGAMAFARSTGTELVKLGAKVATGTQYVLQGAEGMLLGEGGGGGGGGLASDDSGGGGGGGDLVTADSDADADDAPRGGVAPPSTVSLYANQPTGVVQGLRHAYSSLARDLNVARDAIIAVPAEVRESASATGAAKAVMRHAPTIIFRPAIGATKAIGQTLMGATNSLDPQNLRRAEDKYKSGPGRL